VAKTPSAVVYRGPSRYDRKTQIRAVLVFNSANVKTGNMVQLYVLNDAAPPHVAIKTGEDQSVCGSCPYRPTLDGGCYVLTFQGPLNTWRHSHGEVTPLRKVAPLLKGRALRLGAYGDVAALPPRLVASLVRAVKGRVTGYTHGHKYGGLKFVSHLRTSCMLSVESESDAKQAWLAGWRTFRGVSPESAPLKGREIECPTETRDIECVKCGLCRGASLQARSITIPVHGTFQKRALTVINNGKAVA
jgi:hypothetical protein